MGRIYEIVFTVMSLALLAGVILGFLKGSRPPQPIETVPTTNPQAFRDAIIAILAPGISILIFWVGVWIRFTNNRVFDALIAVPLICGAFYGRRAFRARNAAVAVRGLGVLAVIVCVQSALALSIITVFGVG